MLLTLLNFTVNLEPEKTLKSTTKTDLDIIFQSPYIGPHAKPKVS